jgi:hypothetical protein
MIDSAFPLRSVATILEDEDATGMNTVRSAGSACIFETPPTNEPPVVVCEPVTVDADADCQATVAAAEFDGGSTDADMDDLTFRDAV